MYIRFVSKMPYALLQAAIVRIEPSEKPIPNQPSLSTSSKARDDGPLEHGYDGSVETV
jgi:hypothetical protein